MEKKKSNAALVIILLCCPIFRPFVLKDAEFGGADDRGNTLIETTDPDYEPWASPILEVILGGELPGEVESMLFCVQTGIGVGIIAFIMGRFVERKKWMKDTENDGGALS
ncbi:MAG: energy-coupling factor ABC transporter substrate-binding protein [Clostridium sp.]